MRSKQTLAQCTTPCLWRHLKLICITWLGLGNLLVASNQDFRPGKEWLDTQGRSIQAHGGGILFHGEFYYWYGEDKDGPTRRDGACGARVEAKGIAAYRSKDLYNWEPLGLVLSSVNDSANHDLHPSKVIERPKVLYNSSTKKFVMWFHVDDKNYKVARVGTAIADQPEGPFQYLGSQRPNGNESRDMTLFQDDDSSAWLIHSSEDNKTMHIVPLSKDYLRVDGPSIRVFAGRKMEAPALFKHNNQYHFIASGCSGWAPNAARSAVAGNISGPWIEHKNPCVGEKSKTTFDGQSTFVLPIKGKAGQFIFMADQWNMKDLGASRYVWLPITFNSDGTQRIEWQDSWDLSWFKINQLRATSSSEDKLGK